MAVLHREVCSMDYSDSAPTDELSRCGICRRQFDLAAMVRFVHHQLSLQNSTPSNSPPPDPHNTNYPQRQARKINGVSNGTESEEMVTSSAVNGCHDNSSIQHTTASSQKSSAVDCDNSCESQADELEKHSKSPNNALSEPLVYTCFSCGSTFLSAWKLIQHAQQEHCLKICSTPHLPATRAGSPQQHPDSCLAKAENNSSQTTASPASCEMSTSDDSGSPERSDSKTMTAATLPAPETPPRSSLPSASLQSSPEQLQNSFDLPFFRLPHSNKPFHSLLGATFPRTPTSHDFRMDNIISEQFRLHPHLPLVPFDRPRLDFNLQSHHPALGLSVESMDFYSQRLRQLAGSNHMPDLSGSERKRGRSESPTVGSNDGVRDHESPMSTPASEPLLTSLSTSASATVATLTPSVPPGLVNGKSSAKAPRKERPRACEYCHKVFRFQSNLIVHRRIHTGEKPYKCKICSHACTQSSKLKRHMKTHINELANEKAFRNFDIKEEEDSSIQEEEEEEVLSREMDEDELESLEALEVDVPEDLSIKTDSTSLKTEQLTPIPSRDKSSLVGELMDKFGLSTISAYREAYNHALRASVKEDVSDEMEHDTSLSDHSDEGTHDSSSKENGPDCDQRSSLPLMDSGNIWRLGHNLLSTQPALDLSRASLAVSDRSRCSDEVTSNAGGLDSKDEKPARSAPSLWLPPLGLVREYGFNSPALAAVTSASDVETLTSLSQKAKINNNNINNKEVESSLKQIASLSSIVRQPFAVRSSDQLANSDSINLTLQQPQQYQSTSPTLQQQQLHKNYLSPLPLQQQQQQPQQPIHSPSSAAVAAVAAAAALVAKRDRGSSQRRDTCEFCGKVFKNCSNLTVHRRSHTGEKPYRCTMCNYACAQSSKLTRHMKTHGRLGKDVYQCRFCSMPFSVASTLEKHMRKCVVSQNGKTTVLPPVLPGH